MATAVTIQIKVDGAQATQALDAINSKLTEVGVKGSASVKQLGQHASTSLDSVRLLSQEFGLRLPRAIEAMLSRIPAITSGLQSVLGVMASIAAAQVFFHVAEQLYTAYEKYVSLNAAAEKFYETIKKTSQEDVVNTRSLETTQARLDNAEKSATAQRSIANSLWQQGVGALGQLASGNASGLGDILAAHKVQEDSLRNQGNSIQLTRRQIDQQHELAQAQIEAAHAGDASLVGQQKINAELQKKQQSDAENRTYNRKVEGFYGNQVPGSAGEEEQRNKDLIATREADAQKTILAREAYLAITKASDESVRARLTGEELLFQKMKDDLKELRIELANTGKSDQFGAQGGAIEDKYFADLGERQLKRQNEAAKQMRDASAAGLTGAARIQAEHNNRVADINTNPELADDPQAAAQARVAAEQESNQKIAELQTQFSQRMRQIEDGRTEASLSGFARIDAAAAKQVDELNAQYNRDFANGAAEDAHTLAAKQDLQRAITAVNATAAGQRADLTQKNAADDLRYDQQAAQAEGRVREQGAMSWVASYRNALSAIQAEEAEHLAKLQEQADKEGLTYEEVERRRTDIVRTANAGIVEQNIELQHRIAGALQSAFTDPVGFIKSKMEQMIFEIIAGWVMHLTAFKQLFGSTMGGLTPNGAAAGGSAAGGAGVLGSILKARRARSAAARSSPATPPRVERRPPARASPQRDQAGPAPAARARCLARRSRSRPTCSAPPAISRRSWLEQSLAARPSRAPTSASAAAAAAETPTRSPTMRSDRAATPVSPSIRPVARAGAQRAPAPLCSAAPPPRASAPTPATSQCWPRLSRARPRRVLSATPRPERRSDRSPVRSAPSSARAPGRSSARPPAFSATSPARAKSSPLAPTTSRACCRSSSSGSRSHPPATSTPPSTRSTAPPGRRCAP